MTRPFPTFPIMITIPRAVCFGLLLIAGLNSVEAASTNNPPDFTEVRALIKANLPGVTETELNQNALDGLLQGFRGKVQLVDNAEAITARAQVSKATVYDGGIGYLRVEKVAPDLVMEVKSICQAMNTTNRLKGVVFDLRFASGDDYAAAVAVADLFAKEEQALLDWGNDTIKSTAKTNALAWPVAVLVNGETAGAPEALAALFRETGTGLILGNPTRGAAMTAKEFPLPNGQKLKIAAAPVKLAGEIALPPSGVKPDIQVAVTTAEERFFLSDPYALLSKTTSVTNLTAIGTNRVARRTRTTEADLVRARREGANFDIDQPMQRETEIEQPVIRDPALARAVDLLKGLAVVRRVR